MNERIKELAKQAEIKFESHLQHLGVDTAVIIPTDLEKFAELIVRECVQTLIDNSPALYTNEAAEEDWDKGYDRAMEDSVQLIRKHFGVEP